MCEHADVTDWTKTSNVFVEQLTKDVQFRLDEPTIRYFQHIGAELGWSAERVMALYLRYMAQTHFTVPLDLPAPETIVAIARNGESGQGATGLERA
jgi:antitoxin component of RelBE/YafQ-DinJ toxin-antitoxin module